MTRTIIAAAATTVLAATALLGSASTASAESSVGTTATNAVITRTTGVHNAPSRTAPTITVINANTRVEALCHFAQGDADAGSTIWFRIATGTPGGGWVPRSAIAEVPTSLPGC